MAPLTLMLFRARELCESRGGRPGFPSLISPRFLWTQSNTQPTNHFYRPTAKLQGGRKPGSTGRYAPRAFVLTSITTTELPPPGTENQDDRSLLKECASPENSTLIHRDDGVKRRTLKKHRDERKEEEDRH